MLKQRASARPNRRYLLIEGTKDNVESAILEYIGVLGWAKAAPVFVQNSSEVILAVNRESLVNVRAALAMSPNEIKVKRVSGTLKGLGMTEK